MVKMFRGYSPEKTARRSISVSGSALVFVFALISLISFCGTAFAANDTTAGAATARANGDTQIIVAIPYSDDADANNTVRVQWKLCSDPAYAAPPANTIDASHAASPYLVTVPGLTASTCYSLKITYNDSAVVGMNPQTIKIATTWDSTLLHNSNRFPDTTKWNGGAGNGNWGTGTMANSGTTAVSKYGMITCETCHVSLAPNIKRIRGTVTAPNSPTDNFPVGTNTINFQSTTTPDGFGDDTGGHATSQKICEVCHTLTSYHKYNQPADPGHNNNTDCTSCHPHSLGFVGGGVCDSCHGAPPGQANDTNAPAAQSHAKHYDRTAGGLPTSYTAASNRSTAGAYVFDCGICHSTVSGDHTANSDGTVDVKLNSSFTGGTFTAGSTIANNAPPPGSVTFRNTDGTCSNMYCHGNFTGGTTANAPVWGTAASGSCGTCHGASAAAPPAGGGSSHTRHAGNTGIALTCDNCHTTVADSNYAITDMSLHVNKNTDWGLKTTDNKIGSSAKYKNAVTGSNANGTAYGSCSSIYCHSTVQSTTGSGFTGVTYAGPTWGSAGPLGCGACHVDMSTNASATGSHKKHAGTGDYNFDCDVCHGTAYTRNSVAYSGATSTHANYSINLNFTGTGASTTYNTKGSSFAPGSAVYSNCSAGYCHSAGTSVATGSIPANTSANWGSAGPLACDSCHTGGTATGPAYASGGANKTNSHNKHVVGHGYLCVDCHSSTVNSSNVITDTTKHLNQVYDVAGAQISNYTFANNGGTCTTTCHSATLTEVASPQWGTTLAPSACGACHESSPTTGNHTTHLTDLSAGFNRNAICGDCHTGAAEGVSGGAQHQDGNIDVSNGYPANIAKHAAGSGYSSCTTAYCHSNGLGLNQTVAWNSTSTGCDFCHPTLSGKHSSHVVLAAATAYGSTEVNSTAGSYDFGCGNCHPTDPTFHANGTVELNFNPADGGPLKSKNSPSAGISGTGDTTVCNLLYCHSDGSKVGAAIVTGASPQWGSTFSGDACAACHGNSPDTAAHSKHVVGIHYYNIYTGTTGLATEGNTVAGSHGNVDASTTINCNICHNDTVTSSANDQNTICVTCHTGGNAKGNAAIANKSFHVNGTADIAFEAINIKSRAQIRDDITTVAELGNNWGRNANSYKTGLTPYDTSVDALNTATMWVESTKTCNNISCHNGKQATWNSGSNSCSSCHASLTN